MYITSADPPNNKSCINLTEPDNIQSQNMEIFESNIDESEEDGDDLGNLPPPFSEVKDLGDFGNGWLGNMVGQTFFKSHTKVTNSSWVCPNILEKCILWGLYFMVIKLCFVE